MKSFLADNLWKDLGVNDFHFVGWRNWNPNNNKYTAWFVAMDFVYFDYNLNEMLSFNVLHDDYCVGSFSL